MQHSLYVQASFNAKLVIKHKILLVKTFKFNMILNEL